MSGVEILGAVAAVAQLTNGTFKACLKIVKLLSKLENAPKEVLRDVADLEELTRLISSLNSPDDTQSGLVDLTDAQYIKELLDKLNSLGSELNHKLKTLQAQSSDSPPRKLWRDIVSVKRQDELSDLFDRIARTKSSIAALLPGLGIRALQKFKTFNTSEHDDIRNLMGNQHAADQASIVASEHKIIEAIKASTVEQGDRIEQLQLITTDTKFAVQEQSAQVELICGKLETSISKSTAHLEGELKQMETQLTILVNSIPGASNALVAKPQALAEACNQASAYFPVHATTPCRQQMLKDFGCCCRGFKATQFRKRGFFAYFRVEEVDHVPSCPLHLSKTTCRSRGFRVCLHPLLEYSIDIMFNTTSGAGGSSVAPVLRYYSTVQRAESPLFMLFDAFLIQTTSNNHQQLNILVSDTQKKRYQKYLEDLTQKFANLLYSDPSHARVKDERGHTILHDIVGVWLYRAHEIDMYDAVCQMVRLAAVAGVDLEAVDNRGYTALSFIMHTQWYLPQIKHYKRIEAVFLQLDCTVYRLRQPCCGSWVEMIARWISNLVSIPEYAESWGLDPIYAAVLYRSETSLRRVLDKGSNPNGMVKQNHIHPGNFPTPLECVVTMQWMAGFQMLVEAGADGLYALRVAEHRSDFATFTYLLEHSCSLFPHPCSGHRCPPGLKVDPESFNRFGGFYATKDITFAIRIAQELENRRGRLEDLVRMHLTLERYHRICSSQHSRIDVRAKDLYDLLERNGVEIPRSLWPGPQHSVFHIPQLSFTVAKELYARGFVSIDEPDEYGITPLELHCWDKKAAYHSNHIPLLNWFLEKGASPRFRNPNAPSLLFPTVNFGLGTPEGSKLLSYVNQTVDPSLTDNCSCFCSSSGCLPIHLFVFHHNRGHHSRRSKFEQWCNVSQLESGLLDIYSQEMCRLEVFDRLGMAHTCLKDYYLHKHTPYYGNDTKFTVCDGDSYEIQAEDEELREQLELILKAHTEHRNRFEGTWSEFWDRWWLRVDHILPEPDDREFGWHGERVARNATTREWAQESITIWRHDISSGRWKYEYKDREIDPLPQEYAGLNFIDIIRLELFPSEAGISDSVQ
ncbi:hypothetical protein NA57DRAFT_78841 [Rhizodiscina lignyota]|uniref:Fungal N-terminal domain-containing protein n=1 Tax=Rhizodiscina lignyota TaxID=1504668 RepID=A0A9P4M7R4_9PEZI|nr:hypothetical protein NA57DRAFT_78841 [Rhizodiscina lignyota]